MATNPPKGDGHRNGAVRNRSQTQTLGRPPCCCSFIMHFII